MRAGLLGARRCAARLTPVVAVVLLGGCAGSSGSASGVAVSSGSPPARAAAGMAFDPVTGSLVLVGGSTGLCQENDPVLRQTWTFRNGRWSVSRVGPVPDLFAGGVVDDEALHGLIRVGSTTASPNYETWMFTSGGWRQLQPQSSPAAVRPVGISYFAATGPAIVYDKAWRRVVLLVQHPGGVNVYWGFDGVRWRVLAAPAGVSRAFALVAMAYDDALAGTVVAGETGQDTDQPRLVTWLVSHGRWQQLGQQPDQLGAAMAAGPVATDASTFDPDDGTVALLDAPNEHPEDGVRMTLWLLRSGTWKQSPTADGPLSRTDESVTYDSAARAVVVFGGLDKDTPTSAHLPLLADTWLLTRGGWRHAAGPLAHIAAKDCPL